MNSNGRHKSVVLDRRHVFVDERRKVGDGEKSEIDVRWLVPSQHLRLTNPNLTTLLAGPLLPFGLTAEPLYRIPRARVWSCTLPRHQLLVI